MTNLSEVCLASFMCNFGNISLLTDFATFHALFSLFGAIFDSTTLYIFWSALGLCMTGGVIGLFALKSAGTDKAHALSTVGTMVTFTGMVLYLFGAVYVVMLLVRLYSSLSYWAIY